MDNEITLYEKLAVAKKFFDLIISKAKKLPLRRGLRDGIKYTLGGNIKYLCDCYKREIDEETTNISYVFVEILNMIYSLVSTKESSSFWGKIKEKDLPNIYSLLVTNIDKNHVWTEGEKKRKESMEKAKFRIINKVNNYFKEW